MKFKNGSSKNIEEAIENFLDHLGVEKTQENIDAGYWYVRECLAQKFSWLYLENQENGEKIWNALMKRKDGEVAKVRGLQLSVGGRTGN